jgi:hypothetical protein
LLAAADNVRQLGPVVRAVPETAGDRAAQEWLASSPLVLSEASAEVRESLRGVVDRMSDEHAAVADVDRPDELVKVRSGELDTALSVAMLGLYEAEQEATPAPVLSIVRDRERAPEPSGRDVEMEAGG